MMEDFYGEEEIDSLGDDEDDDAQDDAFHVQPDDPKKLH